MEMQKSQMPRKTEDEDVVDEDEDEIKMETPKSKALVSL